MPINAEILQGCIRLQTPYSMKNRCTAVPGGRWLPKAKAWEYPLTPGTANAIYGLFNTALPPDLYDQLCKARKVFDVGPKIKSLPPEITPEIPITKTKPWHHQKVAYHFASTILFNEADIGGGVLLGLDMGCGKSYCAISIVANHTDRIKTVLVVCPHSVVDVWPNQFKIHSDLNPQIVALNKGTVAQKQRLADITLKAAKSTGKLAVVIVNYESLWREPFASWVLNAGFDLVILDELHRIKSAGGVTAKFCQKLGKVAKYRLGLTGTPLPHALASDSEVLTPDGWKKIGQLKIGDHVIGKNGKPTIVKGVWPQGEKSLLAVRFCDGATTICTNDHLWSVISRGRRKRDIGYLTIKTSELSHSRPLPNSNDKKRTNDTESLFDTHKAPRWSIPLADPIEFTSDNHLPIDPYLLGVLLGDGHIGSNIDFTTADQDLVNKVLEVLPNGLQLTKSPQRGVASRYRITSGKKGGSLKGKVRGPKPNPLFTELNALKLRGTHSHTKFIPKIYLWSSVDHRLSLLQGLCDTDGSSYGSTSKFITTSKQLSNDVAFLIRSLGGLVKTSIESKKGTTLPSGKVVDGRDQYHLFFRMKLNPFRMQRKAQKFKIPWRNICRNIVSITPHGVGDATCITVEAEDGLFITDDFIVTHNSPLDAYGQYRFLDAGIFGTSYSKFRSDYAIMGGFENHQVLQYKNLDNLADKMYSVGFRVMSKDVFDLPPFIDETRSFDLTPEDRRIYDEFENELCVMIDEEMITADNALVKLLRLQQMTSGFIADKFVTNGKQKLLADVMEDFAPKEPIVVFAKFTNDLSAIKEIAEKQGRRFAELSGNVNELARWQKGEADVLGVQIRAGREGVDFTRARYCIYYSLGFSLGDYSQSRKRVDRPGQTREGVYYHLVANKTVDEKIMKALSQQEEIVESVLKQYKERN